MGLDGDISSCYYTSDFYQLLISDGFYSYIPLVLIVVINTNILYKIFSKKNLNTNQRRRFSTDVKITFILVADSIIFCILTIPLLLFYFISLPNPTLNVFDIASNATHAINFFVYAFVGGKIRRELKSLFRSNRCKCLYTKPDSTRLNFEMRNVRPLENNLSPSVQVIT